MAHLTDRVRAARDQTMDRAREGKTRIKHKSWHAFRAFVDRYGWIHTGIGLIGNVAFLAGSILFLLSIKPLSIYLFITGSTGMLIGSIGSAIVQSAQWRWSKREDEEHAD